MSTEQTGARRPPRLTRGQRVSVAAVVVLAVAVAGALVLAAGTAETRSIWDTSSARAWPPSAGHTSCTSVQIYSGNDESPYNRVADVLRRRLAAAPEHFTVYVKETSGSTDNIYHLDGPDPSRCALAIAQLNTTVDATMGVNQFSPGNGGHAVTNLATLGPVHQDLLHVIVRDRPLDPGDRPVNRLADLCDRTVAAGEPDSGTRQIGDVLLRVGLPRCSPSINGSGLNEGLRALVTGKVDAVIWAGAPATAQIHAMIVAGARLRMLDLSDQLAAITQDWNTFYGGRSRYFPGAVFGLGSLDHNDYPGIRAVRTITIPNALIARTDTDPALVRRATAELYRNQGEYITDLWGTNPAHHKIPDALSIYEGPLFCYIPLHRAAEDYYRERFGRVPRCGAN
ncbi:TAXI family TRAP transporter solute-binding subunit [Frankia sp. AgB32]|uniref:TAXI family TRAP transporter solute-binding subunit n=1 Tax=Frankia sp. AgB32 TaxID=631119 RepID=UPI00200E67A4|nr:TAXI family TRAP transporter solute-binding subunit [Frankia sp. AgB32]MCK9897623.1 C4-dicarboxylate ABC transporter substrate-binding protein [Frankia sp. AgB32]